MDQPGLFHRPSTAVLSTCGTYRYQLERWWGDSDQAATFVMLNPSTADANTDDPTVRRCVGFAKSWGLDGLRVVNLYALRSTDPRALRVHGDPIGPDNDTWLTRALEAATSNGTPVVAAWGTHATAARVAAFAGLADGHTLHALALTVAGAPKHPLYQRADTPLSRYDPGA